MAYLLATYLFIVTLTVNLVADYSLWYRNIPINHKKNALLRALALLPVVFLSGWQSVLLVLSVYWLLFDGIFNIIRGFNWWFTGSDDADDAKTDNLLQKLTLMQHILLKIIAIVLSLLLFLVIENF